MNEETMTLREVCAYLNISRATLYRRIEDGKIKPLPRQNFNLVKEPLRFAKSDVDKLTNIGNQSPNLLTAA